MMTEEESNKSDISKEGFNDLPKNMREFFYTVGTIMCLGLAYLLYDTGQLGVDLKLNFPKRQQISNLNAQKTNLIGKIKEYQHYIPLMSGDFALIYEGRLAQAVKDTSTINHEIDSLEQEIEQNESDVRLSWAYYFKDLGTNSGDHIHLEK